MSNLEENIKKYENIISKIDEIESPFLDEIKEIESKMKKKSFILRNQLDVLVTIIRKQISEKKESTQTELFNFSYVKPSMIWDKNKLMELAKVHPEILDCQKQKSGCVKIGKRKSKPKKSEPGIFD